MVDSCTLLMTLFSNLFAQSGTEDTVLFTERNPFFASAGDEVRKQQLKARKSSKKKTKKGEIRTIGVSSVAAVYVYVQAVL